MENSSDIDYKEVGERIKNLRGNESQASFGAKYGKSYTDIGRIERGEVKPTPDLLVKICTDYIKSIEWLLTGEGYPDRVAEASAIYNVRDPIMEELIGLLKSEPEEVKKIYLQILKNRKAMKEGFKSLMDFNDKSGKEG